VIPERDFEDDDCAAKTEAGGKQSPFVGDRTSSSFSGLIAMSRELEE
jgi:hypothetical protein